VNAPAGARALRRRALPARGRHPGSRNRVSSLTRPSERPHLLRSGLRSAQKAPSHLRSRPRRSTPPGYAPAQSPEERSFAGYAPAQSPEERSFAGYAPAKPAEEVYPTRLRTCAVARGALLRRLRTCVVARGALLRWLRTCVVDRGALLRWLRTCVVDRRELPVSFAAWGPPFALEVPVRSRSEHGRLGLCFPRPISFRSFVRPTTEVTSSSSPADRSLLLEVSRQGGSLPRGCAIGWDGRAPDRRCSRRSMT